MKAFVGLFAGENMSNCSLLATSANRHIIKTVADLLSGKTLPSSEKIPLRKLRRDRGWRISDVSFLSDGALKPHDLSNIELGRRPATPTEAGALQEIFAMSIAELGLRIVENRDES